jgi:hypothetical protein
MKTQVQIKAEIKRLEDTELKEAQQIVENGEKIGCSDFIMGQRIANRSYVVGKINGLKMSLGDKE